MSYLFRLTISAMVLTGGCKTASSRIQEEGESADAVRSSVMNMEVQDDVRTFIDAPTGGLRTVRVVYGKRAEAALALRDLRQALAAFAASGAGGQDAKALQAFRTTLARYPIDALSDRNFDVSVNTVEANIANVLPSAPWLEPVDTGAVQGAVDAINRELAKVTDGEDNLAMLVKQADLYLSQVQAYVNRRNSELRSQVATTGTVLPINIFALWAAPRDAVANAAAVDEALTAWRGYLPLIAQSDAPAEAGARMVARLLRSANHLFTLNTGGWSSLSYYKTKETTTLVDATKLGFEMALVAKPSVAYLQSANFDQSRSRKAFQELAALLTSNDPLTRMVPSVKSNKVADINMTDVTAAVALDKRQQVIIDRFSGQPLHSIVYRQYSIVFSTTDQANDGFYYTEATSSGSLVDPQLRHMALFGDTSTWQRALMNFKYGGTLDLKKEDALAKMRESAVALGRPDSTARLIKYLNDRVTALRAAPVAGRQAPAFEASVDLDPRGLDNLGFVVEPSVLASAEDAVAPRAPENGNAAADAASSTDSKADGPDTSDQGDTTPADDAGRGTPPRELPPEIVRGAR